MSINQSYIYKSVSGRNGAGKGSMEENCRQKSMYHAFILTLFIIDA